MLNSIVFAALARARRLLTSSLVLLALLLPPLMFNGSRVAASTLWGPVLGNVTPTSIQISWRDGEQPAKGVLFNGKTYGGTVNGRYRQVTLNELAPDTAYEYCLVGKEGTEDYTFHTAPDRPTDITFAVYGDTRSNPKVHRQAIEGMMQLYPRFVINTGDLVANGTREQEWDTFFSVAAPLTGSAPYFAAAGNHEGNASYFYKLFPGAPGYGDEGHEWYATTYGNVHVIILNSTAHVAQQRDWLEKHLAAMQGKTTWTVVTFHYPPFSSGARGGDEKMRTQWVPILEKYHVDAVFLGHDHFYERSVRNGVQYIIAGGGGAPLYQPNVKANPYRVAYDKSHHYLRVDVTPTTMHMTMFRLDGTIGDEVMLTKAAE